MPDRGALVTALILERPLCEPCIVTKSGLSPTEVDTTLTAVAAAVRLSRTQDRCRACGTVTTVLSLSRPS